ncbi:isoaspartyl peptidase/L-asparaginase [Haloplanus aerogenes]|uniref:Plant-type L-asparaginase n=1 Tax=Haloplanus aerogenes TaxID=660522 RepID=A0A3M0CQI6_9EURY|nr:isoaspartyl peptidase/L-asparaginase [Haloplanus aerogenes]AZH26822.1 asparaginase [Haloplanus aerogenes]RMB09086.1 beta-aspartyl-peptidase (threonine type) [Haloplanus aerogenes]
MRVIVHGGAGSGTGAGRPTPARQAVLDAAARDGAAAGTPLDAVESALRRLETDERFNAGRGGAVQSDGVVRVDAGCMSQDRTVGAVAAVPGVEHAVSAARVVAEETPHVCVAGREAAALAADFGVATGVDLTTARTRERFADADPLVARGATHSPRTHLDWLRDRFGRDGDHDHDTVGVVAGGEGRFVAATSTAGRWFALAGRVGDVPQVGAGFFATSAGGASATGAGEDIARVTLSRRAVDHLDDGVSADRAATLAIAEFEELTDSTAGVVVCGPDGVGSATNASMQVAVAEN